ncbi:dnaJ homolog subfamily C member 4-like [Argiope bruennichi]|uniref:DnaJ subfamily C member 4 like protein n=1 Tax=Argiope bruennichi TaxID=94029 RepID=A0A8T0F2W1_ARGBR|nr:dnaJ homolog subfamily C member 4-like [Argiope bruennichi]KAF8784655.1 DnaJ subfamily C member 4 like protein [Argiope bruennichi]
MQCKSILVHSAKISEIWYHSFNVFCVTSKQCRNYSRSRNPYEVLGLEKTCSTRDIKKAYIKLCKELHPDAKPGDDSQHKKFVELNNAYTTLVNSDSRKQFDQKSDKAPHKVYQGVYRKAHGPFDQGHWQKEEAWYEREDYKQYYRQQSSSRPLKHLSNKLIVYGCFVLVIIGSAMYFSAYSFATRYTLNKVDERSRIISENYQDTRKNALDGGREEQVEKLKRRWNL